MYVHVYNYVVSCVAVDWQGAGNEAIKWWVAPKKGDVQKPRASSSLINDCAPSEKRQTHTCYKNNCTCRHIQTLPLGGRQTIENQNTFIIFTLYLPQLIDTWYLQPPFCHGHPGDPQGSHHLHHLHHHHHHHQHHNHRLHHHHHRQGSFLLKLS